MIYVPLADNLVNTPKEKNRLSILSYNIYLRIGNRWRIALKIVRIQESTSESLEIILWKIRITGTMTTKPKGILKMGFEKIEKNEKSKKEYWEIGTRCLCVRRSLTSDVQRIIAQHI